MIDQYFQGASFYKPTGDGLLITFPYSEKTLKSVSKKVVTACLDCLLNFKSICKNDPMINFETPKNVGFGITRGTACCLISNKTILDYSGYLLNLAARLTNLARPSGIVIDNSFTFEMIPEIFHKYFVEKKVYIRGVSEDLPHPIYSLKNFVEIPESVLNSLKEERWETAEYSCTVNELKKLGARFRIDLKYPLKKEGTMKVVLEHPAMHKGKILKGIVTFINFKDFEYSYETGEARVILNMDKAFTKLLNAKVPLSKKVQFRIKYIPKIK